MNVLIIEDEHAAGEKLKTMLSSIDSSINIMGRTESVAQTLHWLSQNQKPDLAFVDIQLSDDTSFEIFRQTEINFPVIFTTAYDEYILEALEQNSIDYLLKPITEERLTKALTKVKNLELHFLQHRFNQLFEQNTSSSGQYKKRFLVKKGVDFVSINTKDIAYFFTEHKIVFLKAVNGTKYIIDKTLTELTEALEPATFFRANRKYIIHIDAIEKFKSDGGKIIVELSPPTGEDVVVSKENAPNFRNWISG